MEKVNKGRIRTSYASVVVSISLVLLLLGVIGVLALNAKKVTDHVRENFAFTIFLKDSAKKVDVKKLQKSLELAEFVKSTEYVSKDEAAESLKEELGEDFVKFLGHNPLKNSIDIHLNAEFVHPDQMDAIEKSLAEKPYVTEVIYDRLLIEQMTRNIEEISFWLLIFAGMFMVVAIALINSSIRLSIYSKRFTIKTMQLVGATKSFIRKPFILHNIKLGVLGALVALSLLSGMLYYLQLKFPILSDMNDLKIYGVLYLGVLISGMIIALVSTFFAMNKYLSLKTEELYY
ncbi:MAG: permease-like cell division protein FtsX [Bacteroidota bacterium]